MRVIGVVLGTALLALLVAAAVPFWLLTPRCANDVLSEIASPDGSRKAVIFDRDCGATTPFSTQVSLLPADAVLGGEPGNLFAADAELGDAGPRVAVRWDDATHIAVQYEAGARVSKAEPALGGLAARYAAVTVEAPSDDSPPRSHFVPAGQVMYRAATIRRVTASRGPRSARHRPAPRPLPAACRSAAPRDGCPCAEAALQERAQVGSSAMTGFVRIASKKEIPSGQGRMFEIEGRQVAVFNVAGAFYAIDNRCEHQQGPLADGDLDGCVVTCPWHGWTYDVSTGQSPDDAETRVATFSLRLEGDDVLVAVADDA